MINAVAPEISYACQVLFGPHVKVSVDFLHTLNPAALKSAFKKRALETHPDRARLLNQDAVKLSERFKTVSAAYERLHSMLDKKSDRRRVQGRNVYGYRAPVYKTDFSDRFYNGKMPGWPLLLGRYLYYSGRIPWGVLIEAITWQRRQRPSIGQMALASGFLTPNDIKKIVHYRKVGERFGECAVRLGLLNSFRLQALLKQQRQIQRPIGTYFVERGFLTSAELFEALKNQRSHNCQVSSKVKP